MTNKFSEWTQVAPLMPKYMDGRKMGSNISVVPPLAVQMDKRASNQSLLPRKRQNLQRE